MNYDNDIHIVSCRPFCLFFVMQLNQLCLPSRAELGQLKGRGGGAEECTGREDGIPTRCSHGVGVPPQGLGWRGSFRGAISAAAGVR